MALQSNLLRGDPKLEAAAESDQAHITLGARGAHVEKIQQALNETDGYQLFVDGIYGSATAAAVLAYKRARNIVNLSYQTQADNIVGRMTIKALDRELLGSAPEPIVIIGTPTFGQCATRQLNLRSFAGQVPAIATTAGVSAVIRGNPYIQADANNKDGLPPSVPPGHSYMVNVSVDPPLTGDDSIDLDIVSNGPLDGIAVIRPKQIKSSTKVIVLGSQQTEPGHAGNLKIQASLNGKVLAVSDGFSVCAHPNGITEKFFRDIDELGAVGMYVLLDIGSDSGALSHLDKVEFSELVDPFSRDEPPFGGGSGFVNNSGYMPCTPPPGEAAADRHAEPRPSLGPKGATVKVQVHMFKCHRCGAVDIPIPKSGYQIKHEVFKAGKEWKHKVTKTGLDTGVIDPVSKKVIKTTAGLGRAESPLHKPGPK